MAHRPSWRARSMPSLNSYGNGLGEFAAFQLSGVSPLRLQLLVQSLAEICDQMTGI